MKKRFPVIILAVIMLASCLTCAPVSAKSKSKKPVLLKSVTVYDINGNGSEWEKTQKRTFTYKKKYPTQQIVYDYDAEFKTVKTFRYTFRGKLPVKMILKSSDADGTETYEYTKRGLVSRIISSADEYGRHSLWFMYGTKNYFTTVLHDNIYIEGNNEGGTEDNYAEEIDSVTVKTRKNGLLKKTVNRGLFANYSYARNRNWSRFNGVYTAKYDKKGIVRQTSAKFSSFPGSGPQLRFKVYRKNGLIKKVIRYNWNPEAKKGKGAWEKSQKFVFKYTGKKISKIRYASMINAQIMDIGNNYYMYNWY